MSEPTPESPRAADPRFDPEHWIVIEELGIGIPRKSLLERCRQCGETTFTIRIKAGRENIACPSCVPLQKNKDEVVIGTMDLARRRYRIDPDYLRRRRATQDNPREAS